MSFNKFLSCPEDCTTEVIYPAVAADPECTSFDLFGSQIRDIVIKPGSANGPTDWANAADWATVVDNTNTDNTKCKRFAGIGSLPAPEKVKITLHAGKQKTRHRDFTLTFTIQNVDDANYEFARKVQCGDTKFRFWFGAEQHLFGGQNGIAPREVDADLPLEEAAEEMEKIVLIFSFRSDGNPDRTANPFA